MATKTLFRSARMKLVGTVLASVGGLALAACCCDPCGPKNPCYKRPCCSQNCNGCNNCSSPCGKSCGGAPSYSGNTGKPATPPGTGGQMSCGAGKCG